MAIRSLIISLLLLLVAGVMPVRAMAPPPPPDAIDRVMQRAVDEGLISGGVVLVGCQEGVLLERAYGRRGTEADAVPVSQDTLFDLASLTKVVATAPAVMLLAEEGRLSLVDPVVRWFPELAGQGKDAILVVHLLTHTSGLADLPLKGAEPLAAAIATAIQQPLKGEPGQVFRYADLNFILLGELVRRVSGQPLDRFAAERFYRPLGMGDTGFLPDAGRQQRAAATVGPERRPLRGVPQDEVARQLGGIAGHAGLFATAADLARFCRMILAGGLLDGRRVLAERTVTQMTVPYFSRGGKIVRGLGWDIDSPFSTPRGDSFQRTSFGHTGYSGTSLWIDPDTGIFVVVLTSRLDYKRQKDFRAFRGEVSSAAAQVLGIPPRGDEGDG